MFNNDIHFVITYLGADVLFSPHSGNNQLVTRLKIWRNHNMQCHGRFQRNICLANVGQLQQLGQSPKMFFNKFRQDYHPLAYDCMEEKIFSNIRMETQGIHPFLNDSYYKNMDFVKNHV